MSPARSRPKPPRPERATAFAPATVANVAVGFDILGFSMSEAGDTVTVTRRAEPGVSVKSLTGVVTSKEIPLDARKNTASVALEALLQDVKPGFGLSVEIQKGIPLGSGMGGSAASAVGAVVAANALLEAPLSPGKLLGYALEGEAVASGSKHADNVAPCLYGGLTLALSLEPLRIVPIPTPPDLLTVLVHPHLKIETKHARAILKPSLLLKEHVRQSANLAGFVSACHRGDLGLLASSMIDLVIEPQRAGMIPGFYDAKSVATGEGALGFSISGSGPSVFAWAANEKSAERIRAALLDIFEKLGIGADSWIAPLRCEGARVIA